VHEVQFNFAEGGGGGISWETSSPEIFFNIFEYDTSFENKSRPNQDDRNYQIIWDASHVLSGFYFSHFIAQSGNNILFKKTSKLLMLK
jgi:hypothetical protein